MSAGAGPAMEGCPLGASSLAAGDSSAQGSQGGPGVLEGQGDVGDTRFYPRGHVPPRPL